MEVRAAFRTGKHLVRIATVLWIKNAPQRAHRLQVVCSKLFRQQIHFLDADSVLTSHAAAEFNALLQDISARLHSLAHLLRVAFIIKDQGVDITVTRMENVWDAQSILFRATADEAHNLWQLRTWHDAVLREKVRAQP